MGGSASVKAQRSNEWFQVGLKWFRVGLEIFGAVSLIGMALFFLWPSSDRHNAASRKDMLRILNQAEISTNHDFKILGSPKFHRGLL